MRAKYHINGIFNKTNGFEAETKDDFQSVLRTFKSLFMFIVMFHEWRQINSKFHANRHYGREATRNFVSFLLVSFDETTLQL